MSHHKSPRLTNQIKFIFKRRISIGAMAYFYKFFIFLILIKSALIQTHNREELGTGLASFTGVRCQLQHVTCIKCSNAEGTSLMKLSQIICIYQLILVPDDMSKILLWKREFVTSLESCIVSPMQVCSFCFNNKSLNCRPGSSRTPYR